MALVMTKLCVLLAQSGALFHSRLAGQSNLDWFRLLTLISASAGYRKMILVSTLAQPAPVDKVR